MCAVADCPRRSHARGWCLAHYKRWRRHGDPTIQIRFPIQGDLWDRFWPKVDAYGDCWEWTAARNPEGYGRIGAGTRGGPTLHAHRVAWEFLVGPIPAGYDIDHLCRNTGCVNPDHLQPVTRQVNAARGHRHKPLSVRLLAKFEADALGKSHKGPKK